jgi:hypothetical protein
MGEEGEATLGKSFTESFESGGGRSSRSPVALHGEVGKKKRRRNKELEPN